MTERREGSRNTRDNVRDDLDEASDRKERDASRGAIEEEEKIGGAGREGQSPGRTEGIAEALARQRPGGAREEGAVDRGGADPFAGLREASEEYKVYDSSYQKIGKVDDLIAGEDDRVLYIGVKMGFFGTNSTLIPVEIIRVNDKRRLIEVSEPAETIKHAPHFGRSEELTPELENHVRTYFRLESLRSSPEHESRASHPEATATDDRVDLEPGERASRERSAPAAESIPQEEERPAERQPPERAEDQEPISERLSDEPEGLRERLTPSSGVTVHRLRR